MKKHITLRFLGLLVVYAGILLLLGMIQFAEKGAFTRQVGSILVTGHYRSQEYPNQYTLTGSLSVSFGGIEFSINDGDDRFSLVKSDGTKEHILPESMVAGDETVTLEIPGGTKLVFTNTYMMEKPELTISAVLGAETVRIELPYKPLKSAKVQEQADGQFIIAADGIRYRFNKTLTSSERYILTLQPEAAAISYRIVLEEQMPSFSPKDFIIPSAYDKQSYDRVIARWREQNFSIWGKNISSTNNEDLVAAYSGEAISRGTYSTAVSSVPAGFLNGNRRTYESSVFLGRLDQALRSMVTIERDKTNQLAQQIQEQSLDFLKEPHIFEYFAIRGDLDLIGEAVKAVQSLTPDNLPPDLIIGILEGYADWDQYRSIMEKAHLLENPFEKYIAQVYLLIAQGLHKAPEGDRVLVFFENTTELEFNLRLGKALMLYADKSGNTEWAAIGRSLILSVLSLVNDTGTAPVQLFRSEDGNIHEAPDTPRFSSARLYRILNIGENYPHAVSISAVTNSIWAWTAVTALSITEEEGILDIAITFPVGETHYMLIRGVPLPSKLQLYEIDYRTAPDFERYNSSGWSYSASERTLLVKLRHRSQVEHIRIFK